jgi:hypothetical protein
VIKEIVFFILAEPVGCFSVTLDYRIVFYIQGSNYNIFDIKTFWAVLNVEVSNFVMSKEIVKYVFWRLKQVSFFIETTF